MNPTKQHSRGRDVTSEVMAAPGWYRKDWTADIKPISFRSQYGYVAMSVSGWMGICPKGRQLGPFLTIKMAMKALEQEHK